MKKLFSYCAWVLVLGLVTLSLSRGALSMEEKDAVNPYLGEKGVAFMERQTKALLGEVEKTLDSVPPQYPESRERFLTLLLLDSVLHDPFAARRPEVQEFFHRRVEKALHEIETTRVEEGARIWKLYNMGFIVRTQSVTLAFDLERGISSRVPEFALSEETAERLVDQCDVLFISHKHRDHTDLVVAQTFLDQGKPVVAPPQVWEGEPIHDRITHLAREAHTLQTLSLGEGKPTLEAVVYPGHQMADTENNVPLVKTAEGLTFSHLGDQINEGDFMIDYDWIDRVKDHHRVDVMMPPCWTNEILRIVEGFNPGLVLPGHENELGHPVDDRVPYWGDSEFLNLTYPQLKASHYPVIVMIWGESVAYHRPD